MNEPSDTSTEAPKAAPEPPKSHWGWVLTKALASVAGGAGTGLLLVIGGLVFLLFVVAPALLEFVANTFGS